MNITLPNGTVINGIPEGTSKEDIMRKAISAGLASQEDFAQTSTPQSATPVQRENEPYLDQVSRRFSETDFANTFSSAVPEFQRRMQAVTPEGMDPLATDTVLMGVSQAARTSGELVSQTIAPLISTDLRQAAGDGWDVVANSDWGKEGLIALESGYEAWSNFSKTNPALAERLGSYVDVGVLTGPRPDLLSIDKAAIKATRSTNKAKIASEKAALTTLLQPEVFEVSDVLDEEGVFREAVWKPREFQQDVIDTVQTFPKVNPYKSVHYNFRAIQKHIDSQKQTLDNYVKSQNKKINPTALRDELRLTLEDFRNSDSFVVSSDDAQKAFNRYAELALKVVNDEGKDLLGVLKGRRRFDKVVQGQGGNILDPDVATAKAEAASLVRRVMNDFVKRNTVGDEVHHLLDQQSKGLSALDLLVNKRNKEGRNSISRFFQGLADVNISLPKTPLFLAGTASFLLQPEIAATVAGVVGGTLIGQQIKRHGKAAVIQGYAQLLKAGKGVQTLEADRLVLIDMLEEARSYKEPEDE